MEGTFYERLAWLYFRFYCWLFSYNGLVTSHRVDTPNIGLLAEIWHGYYPYLDKVLISTEWNRYCETTEKGTSFYVIIKLTWGPAKLDPFHKQGHTINECDLAFLADSITSVVAIKL